MKKSDFIKGVERLVDPMAVGAIHFVQPFNKLLPKTLQKKIVTATAKRTPSMGFVVEPYAFFLCYEIADESQASSLLPDGFKLLKTSIFKGDTPKYYGIIGCFRAHTSAFWGTRAECYVIAEDEATGMESWIILDYDSDTISYDSSNGLKSPNSSSVHATDYDGVLHVDITRHDGSRRVAFTADLNDSDMRPLDQRLWLEGNLSIGYGRILSENNADLFSLKFEPGEVKKAMQISPKNVEITENSWYPGLFESSPSIMACFPFAQHFVSDSPGASSQLHNKRDLENAIDKIDFTQIKTMSAKPFTTMLLAGSAISTTIILILIAALIIK